MYLKKSISNGRTYLAIVHGFRQNGKVKQKTIESLGYLDELEKQYDDPIAFFTDKAKQMTTEFKNNSSFELSFSNLDKLSLNENNRLNVGYFALQNIYYELGINIFFQNKQPSINAKFNLNSIMRLLTFSRILNPASKKASYDNKENYFENFNFSLDDVYRSLDYFNQYKDELQIHLHNSINSIYSRDTSIAYYDCTNYYFEIDYNDEDTIDEDGNTIKKGLRKKGPSKENRRSPIVQMGLLMDNNGIPMAYDLFPGNESEKTSLRPILSRTKSTFGLDKVVVVADKGLNTSDNIFFNQRECDGYVYSQTVRGGTRELKEYVLNQDDYTVLNGGFKYKSRIYSKDIKIKREGKRKHKTTVIQKQVIFYSPDYAKKARHDREKVLEKARNLITNPSAYTRATSVGAAGYINNIQFDEETGVIVESQLTLDFNKIKEEEKFDGYYAIVTSEVEKDALEIIETYRGLWKIEESFKVIKSEFKARPVYLSLDEHIEGHFLICFISLIIMRLLEIKLDHKYSVKKIVQTLNKISCSHLKENYYLFNYRDEMVKDLEQVFSVDLSNKVVSKKIIKKIFEQGKKA